MQRLIILGDSFAIPTGDTDPAETWTSTLGKHVEQLTGQPVEVKNGALVGSAQDWAWKQLNNYMPQSQPDDLLVVCLTHPSRFWFLEDLPQMTNVSIIDFDRWITKDQERAIEGFVRYIQRPELDTQLMINRMGWLAYHVAKRGLRRPLMIKCFRQEVGETAGYEELNWADGNLFDDIQYWEFENPEDDHNGQYWYGLDGRYNHMILSNHKILAPRIAQALVNETTLDLKQGFIRGVLKKDTLEDQDFVQKELCTKIIDKMWEIRERENGRPFIPWLKKKRLAEKIYPRDSE